MDLYDWLVFLHVLFAFVTVGSLTALWWLVFETGGANATLGGPEASRFGKLAGILVGVGMMGTLVFGIWLALDVDGYGILDFWIIAALVLWMVGGWAGGAAGKAFEKQPEGDRAAGIRLQAINTIAVLIILILMIWKPGA